MTDFALIIKPFEANLLIPDWPDNLWLVAVQNKGTRYWDCGFENQLPEMVGSNLVWPAYKGFKTANVNAEDEIELLRHLVSIPGLLDSAQANQASLNSTDDQYLKNSKDSIKSQDIEWDDF